MTRLKSRTRKRERVNVLYRNTGQKNGALILMFLFSCIFSFGLLLNLHSAYADIDTGLVGHWTFDEGTGMTAADSSGSGYNATILTGTSTAVWVGGRIGQAISLDGQDDYVDVGQQASFGNLSAITVTAWVYPKSIWNNQYGFIQNVSYGSNLGFGLGGAWNGTASSRVMIGNTTYDFNTPVPAIDLWTHIAFTYNVSANQVIFYKNGIGLPAQTVKGVNVPVSTLPFLIGKYLGSTFNGFIDDVRVYNRALTAQEISDVYNYTGAPANNPPPADSGSTPDTTSPSVPTNLSSSNVTETQATISWTASSDDVGVSGYKIYRNNVQISSVTSGTLYTDSGLSAASTYLYRISAFDAAGNASSQSSPLSVLTAGQSVTTFGTTELLLPHVIQGRSTYGGQNIMWKDPQGHINIINSFGGDETGVERAYIHYINTFTGAHALVEGGPCAFGRNSIYDPLHNKFYWYGEYCSNATGGSFNEFDPVTMTNTIIKLGGSTWYGGQAMALGADNRIYFTAINTDYSVGGWGHLYSYDPAIGASSWNDYGGIYGPSNGLGPGLTVDANYIYVAWQEYGGNLYWHLMVHPIGNGTWTEINFGDGLNSTGMRVNIDRTNKKRYLNRTANGVQKYYWLENGGITATTGTQPSTGNQTELDLNVKNHISMMGYGNYGQFIQAYNYDMNWDNLIPTTANPVSTVTYGPHSTWNYPTSGFTTSSLTYSGPWFDMPVDAIVPHGGNSNFYAFGDIVSDYNYLNQSTLPVGSLSSASIYYALKVPASYSPIGTDEIYYSGYPNQVWRWNPSAPRSASNPLNAASSQPMNYRVFLDYDSAGKIWMGGNACGATPGCIDYGGVAWYDPVSKTNGEMFNGVWTGGNPPATGNGIQFANFAMSNGRTKVVVSSSDGNLTVIDATTKIIEGTYSLGTTAWMVEVANDQILGVTTSSDASGERVFLFQPSTRTMIKNPQPVGVSGNTFGTGNGHIARRAFKLELGPDGYAWLYVDNKIYRINPTTLAFQYVITDTSASTKLKWSDNGKDLIVYGGLNTSYFPNLLNGAIAAPTPPSETRYMLNVSKSGGGNGIVIGGTISCGEICSQTSNSGMQISMSAAPLSGSTFTGWSGGGCSGTGSCSVTLSSNVTVTANFNLSSPVSISGSPGGGGGGGGGGGTSPYYILTVTKQGTGLGTATSSPLGITCGSTCSYSFYAGSTVVLNALPQTGSHLTSWTGCTSIATSSCTVLLSASKTITVNFGLGSATTTITNTAPVSLSNCPTGMICTPIPNANTGIGIGANNQLATTLITKLLSIGSIDPQVILLQELMNSNGYPVTTSGAGSLGHEIVTFGPATVKALQKFQCAKLYICSSTTTGYGSTDQQTRNALNALPNKPTGTTVASLCPAGQVCTPIAPSQPPTTYFPSLTSFNRSLTLGSTGSDVTLLQETLNSLGYIIATTGNGSPGHESTYFGLATQTALQRYQCTKGIACSSDPGYGMMGPRTIASIGGKTLPVTITTPATTTIIPTKTTITVPTHIPIPTPAKVSTPTPSATTSIKVPTSASSTPTPTPTKASTPPTPTPPPLVQPRTPPPPASSPTTPPVSNFSIPSSTNVSSVSGLPLFTTPLSTGSTGKEVKNLQIFLNDLGFTVATSGPESPGHETQTYDAATAAAVKRFQKAYSSQIASYGGSALNGVFDSSTMEAANGVIGE